MARPSRKVSVSTRVPQLTASEWTRRRLRLDIALTSILVLVCWIIFSGNDTVLYQQGLIALIGAGVALIGQYIFGAVWDDKNYMSTLKDLKSIEEDYSGDPSVDVDVNVDNTK